MPPYRRKIRCAGYDAEPKPKASKAKTPRAAPRTRLTDEERAQRREEAAQKKALTEKKEWKAMLKPWTLDPDYRLRIGTITMYKTDAQHVYGLTEHEILTLPHECIPFSYGKTHFACRAVGDLALRKAKFFDPAFVIPPADASKPVSRGLVKRPIGWIHEKTKDENRRRKENFSAAHAERQLERETKDPKFYWSLKE